MDFEGFYEKCKRLGDRLKKEGRLTVVGHYDADGLASTAIMVKALQRLGKEVEFINTRQLDSFEFERISAIKTPILFVDMGSGQLDKIEKSVKNPYYIIDHHPPVRETENQVNPFFYGIDGTRELSATGACYFVAKAMDEKNIDLSPVGIVGSVGDMQDLHGGLIGANRIILEDGKGQGLINYHKNLTLFGRQSRPLPKMLEYASEPILPGLSGNYNNCVQFLMNLGIEVRDPVSGEFKHYVELDQEERKKLTSALYMLLLDHHAPHLVTDMLISEIYEFPKEKIKTELRDAREFATVLNACGRNDEPKIGVAVCMGDRKENWLKARTMLEKHRRELRKGLDWVKETGIQETDNIYFFDASGVIKETIVGVIAGMVYGAMFLEGKKPIIAFATNDEGDLKISARGNYGLVRKGLKLGAAMNEACRKVNGEGGGHDVAAGARIPPDKKEEFLRLVDEIVKRQFTG
ncbi:MAG: DHH family phosphoesterase [Candidatus Altiarchaeota archaeon]|nr:DHH family phosphoesterase [Candidatus Altiarchaeota archaeon]